MTQTDLKVLDDILSEAKDATAQEMDESEFFEFFAAEHVLRDEQLDAEEVESGLVSGDKGGSDGWIDAFYLLVNGKLIRDTLGAENLKSLKQNVQIDVIIIQASRQTGFTLDRLLRPKDTSETIFTLDLTPDKFAEKYNDSLLDAIERFRIAHRVLAHKFPTIHVAYFYVTKGDVSTLASDIKSKAEEIEKAAKNVLATISKCSFGFIGARQLIELATKPPKYTFSLRCQDTLSSTRGGYVALVRLTEYLRFITSDATSELLGYLFESNVRDYQGDVSVNEAIKNTLRTPGPEEFWWLNNGITVVAEKVGGHPKELVLEEPQVVNGLQTSKEIFDFFQSNPAARNSDEREVMVRIIGSTDVDVQDHIIRATNSQTSIPIASLWATETIHRDIERIFRSNGLHYDRRKNSWRMKGVPLSKVVGITELAQAVAAICLQEPDHARARPARYFQKEETYEKVFTPKYPIDLYVVCASIPEEGRIILAQE